ncbi:MAG: hypothetical protein U9R25_17055 [Chloroflexota bacterium]|nr:hypothetical protein [Chloroflexota bacterium]
MSNTSNDYISLRIGLFVSAALILLFLTGCEGGQLPPPPATPTPATGQSDSCVVADIERIGLSGGGLDWSQNDDNLILMSRYDENGITQVYTIKTDGTDEICLTCQQVPGGPAVGLHKGVAHWHPSGDYIVLQVEMAEHEVDRDLAQPGSGRANNIWAMTADGSRWWQLTRYDDNPEAGVLFPVPSNDGSRLAWSERHAGPENPFLTLAKFLMNQPTADLWGQWRVNVADMVFDDEGPRLDNIERHGLDRGFFYEVQSWSPDDSKIYFASEGGQENVYLLDIWEKDLETQALRNLTNNPGNWEEHLGISPSGKKMLYDSSSCCSWDSNQLKTLRMELYMMDADGSNAVQLTHFNTSGYPESSEGQSVVAKGVWSPDGRQVALQRIALDQFTEGKRTTDLWILTFAGPCGVE